MDFKGITWAGNIYEKFEAMCLEVEEVMYEDTVKYVENQVQKVGVSVKKFYSEVMQDLLPPSCVDPVKVAAGDLSLNPYAHTDINKKPKLCTLTNDGELKKKETEDEDISALTAEKSALNAVNDGNHLSPPSPRVLVENTCSEAFSTKNKKLGAYKRPIGIRRISQNNHPPKMSRPVKSLSGERACDMRSGCMVTSDDMNVTTSSEFFARCDHEEAVNKDTPVSITSVESRAPDEVLLAEAVRQEKDDSKFTSPASDEILSAESLMQKKDDSECTSSSHHLPIEPIGASVKVISFSESSSSSRSKVLEVESGGKDVRTSGEDKFQKDGSFSQTSSNISSVESVGEEVIVSCEDNFGIEPIEDEDTDEAAEIFKPAEKSKLEETCILVEGDELDFVSQGAKKNKSYKKKFREVFSLRSAKKQDPRVSQYKDLGGKINEGAVTTTLTMDSDRRKLRAYDNLESDWELL
ncbi:hypothetical protein CDL12_21070 [Handroanthus impetiginosus]|uniref:Uncharacterized protein n=1 Tax=Handroanthus impetiginosus TaxID=429701 RepID=A0A2G9GMD6_9LAMI|nr:hypothetical protein CDL12_21070 [Handroanthus impetiginosus]